MLFFIYIVWLSVFCSIEPDVRFHTDTKQYEIGDTIVLELRSDESFAFMTDGDCSSSVLPPYWLKKENGIFPMVEMGPQMCCGLPYSPPMKKWDSWLVAEEKGVFKIALFLDVGVVYTNEFIIE